jgi:site-specific recombinase XerC
MVARVAPINLSNRPLSNRALGAAFTDAHEFSRSGPLAIVALLYSGSSRIRLEWRNWQTHGTQNPATFTGHVGSTPTSSTKKIENPSFQRAMLL